ncbi:hypothetical protein [Acrocarpospora sp. B8E8]|uniref:hypothetical protein n=1 Tax=Acrocarpospora sp. B8E8 TaxID=3153572 RepID=UPI00325FAE16
MIWLQRPATQTMLTTLIATDRPISHEALDHLRPAKAAQYLRDVLVTNGLLPPRDEYLSSLERWLPTALPEVASPAERRIVQSFATWYYLRRLRRASKIKIITYGQMVSARHEILAAIKLLAWLQDRGATLATCTQADIDLWLDQGPWMRELARNFLVWTARNHHSDPFEFPGRPTSSNSVSIIEEDERWNQIQQLLHDEDLDLSIRVGGLLVLLFAQPLSRIVRIATSDITQAGSTVSIALGAQPLDLPPPLDALVLRLRDAPSPNHRDAARPKAWLLGSAHCRPGKPFSSQQLGYRLNELGIQARCARNTALMELAAELPAAVLAELLGLHLETASNWKRRAGAPRAEYAAELARRKGDRG